jgi:hypothetical protein
MPGRCRSCCGVEITVDLCCIHEAAQPVSVFAGILPAHLQSRPRRRLFSAALLLVEIGKIPDLDRVISEARDDL